MKLPVLLACVGLPATVFAAVLLESSFLGAPAGVPLSFTTVALPPVSVPVVTSSAVTSHPVPGVVGGVPFVPAPCPAPWAPSLEQLLNGNTLITSDARMRDVWQRLFAEPYDPAAFDFDASFVVLMGGGPMDLGTFEITAAEDVAASYTDPMGTPPLVDRFLCVTATTFLPGVPPKNQDDPTYRLSAIELPRALLDDVVFHRALFAAP